MQSYGGDVRELWKYFDQDNSDIVTLKEFDPESHKLTTDFKEQLVAIYGSVVKGWTDCLDKEKIVRCPKDRFLAGCATIQYPHDAEKLYNYFDTDQSQFISIEEIDSRAHEAFLQGRQEAPEGER